MAEKKLALNKQKQWVHYDSHIYIIYPLVNIQKTMENHNFQWVNPLQIAIFNSYVKLPEGISFNIPVESQLAKTRLLTQLFQKTRLSKCPEKWVVHTSQSCFVGWKAWGAPQQKKRFFSEKHRTTGRTNGPDGS